MNLIDGRADKDVEAFIQESHEFGECQHKVKYFDALCETLDTSLPKEINLGMFELHCEDLIQTFHRRTTILRDQIVKRISADHQEENKRLCTEFEAISSTAIRVTWQLISDNPGYVEGFFIRFRDMSGGSQKFNMKTVMNSGQAENGAKETSHIITGLRKYTEYEVFLMPFYKKLEGQPSNSLHIQTLEDVPSAPPTNLRAEMVNQSSAHLSWAPPPPQHRNGILKGYQIHVKGNGSAFHYNLTLNATTTNYVLTNLSMNEEYSVRAVAFTTIGLGPFSPPTHFLMDPSYLKFSLVPKQDEDVLSEPWFLALLGSVVFTVLLLIFVGIILYRKQWSRQKALCSGPGSLQQHYEDMTRLHPGTSGNTIWVNGGWKEKLQEQQQQQMNMRLPSENVDQGLYAEVGEAAAAKSHLMSTFASAHYRVNDPAPYATTTLAMQNRIRTLVRTQF